MEIDKEVIDMIKKTRKIHVLMETLKTELKESKENVVNIEKELEIQKKEFEENKVRCSHFLFVEGGKIPKES